MAKRVSIAVALGAAALGACATPLVSSRPGDVYVMRHLQAGTGSDPSLTAEGARQARLLVRWFRSKHKPRALYVTRFRRSQETAAPLAASLGVTPIVYDPANNEALVQMVRSGSGDALVVGHSNTVPDIVEKLGGARPAPIGHDRHGDVWRVSAGKTDKLRLDP